MRELAIILGNVLYGSLLWKIYRLRYHIPQYSSIYIFTEQDSEINDIGIKCLLKSHAKGMLMNPVILCADLNTATLLKSKLPNDFVFIMPAKRVEEKIIIYANFFTKIEFHIVSLDKPSGNRSYLTNQFAGICRADIIEKCIFNEI